MARSALVLFSDLLATGEPLSALDESRSVTVENVRRVLNRIANLLAPSDLSVALREQQALIVRLNSDLPYIGLEIAGTPKPISAASPLPVNIQVVDDNHGGTILLYHSGGLIDCLEYARYVDKPAKLLPLDSELTILDE